ncbi:MAG: hypothetical protein U1F87_05110 [Kiritimatiellia bacterium]
MASALIELLAVVAITHPHPAESPPAHGGQVARAIVPGGLLQQHEKSQAGYNIAVAIRNGSLPSSDTDEATD